MSHLLTEAELEIMHVLWKASPATVRQVHSALVQERDVAYTTVATMLRILADKGFASVDKSGRTLVYAPTVAAQRYEKRGVRDLVERLFHGDAVGMVRSLVETDSLSHEDLTAIEALIAAAKESDR